MDSFLSRLGVSARVTIVLLAIIALGPAGASWRAV
jgi:hypothetical protein